MSECKQMHFERKAMGRKDGSALKKASYRSTVALFDVRLNKTFKSNCNDDFISRSKILAPEGTPEILLTQEGLWNAAEAAERQKNSVYAQEFNAGLPHELTAEQQEDLIDDFMLNHYVKRGIICDTNIHMKPDNNHFHGMMTTRQVDVESDTLFSKGKARDWWKLGSIQKDRDAYCSYINKHLELAGSEVRYSGDTLEKQGIDRVPQIHVGPKAIAIDDRGEHSDKVEINKNIINFNVASAKLKDAKAALEKAKEDEKAKQKAEQEPSSKQKAMVQSQYDYLHYRNEVSEGWSRRKDWFEMKPVEPHVDTIDGSKFKKNIGIWNNFGQKIRNVVKNTLGIIKTLVSDYKHEHDRDLREDALSLLSDMSGGGTGGASVDEHVDESIEINGP